MPATISAAGTWTTLSITGEVASAARPRPNTPVLEDIDFAPSLRDTDLNELVQFIQLVATNYTLSYHAARLLVQHALTALTNRESPAATTIPTYSAA